MAPRLGKERAGLAGTLDESLRRELSARAVSLDEAVAQRLGLNVTDQRCLDAIQRASRERPVTAGKLAELTELTTGAITGVLDRLERAGFVRREKDAADKRQVQIKLVPERLTEVEALFAPMKERWAELCADYTGEQLQLVEDFARRAAGLLASEAARLRDEPTTAPTAHELSSPLGDVRAGYLELTRGASDVTLDSLRGAALYRARSQGPAPDVTAREGRLRVAHNRSALRLFSLQKQTLSLELNERIPWEIDVRGGATRLQANLRALSVLGVRLRGGVVRVTLDLPQPSGTVPIQVDGGANDLRILRPKRVPIRLQVNGGVHQLAIDTLQLGAVGGTMRWESPEYEGASDRYDVQVRGGAQNLSVSFA
ncbi:MAG TPA: MarR family transcriptional regulator [Polyangiales bacterium]